MTKLKDLVQFFADFTTNLFAANVEAEEIQKPTKASLFSCTTSECTKSILDSPSLKNVLIERKNSIKITSSGVLRAPGLTVTS